MAKRKARKNRRKNPGNVLAKSRYPGMYRPVSSVRRTFRFTVTTACSGGVMDEAQFLMLPGGMCTVTNTTLTSLSDSVKLHRITMYGAAPAAGSVATVSVRFIGVGATASANLMTDLVFSDSSNNPSVSPYLSIAPPRGSRQSFWLSADNSGADGWLCIESAPVSTVIDFDVEFTFGEVPSIGQFDYGIGTGVLKVLYWPTLNLSATAGTGIIQPVGLTTTT